MEEGDEHRDGETENMMDKKSERDERIMELQIAGLANIYVSREGEKYHQTRTV